MQLYNYLKIKENDFKKEKFYFPWENQFLKIQLTFD